MPTVTYSLIMIMYIVVLIPSLWGEGGHDSSNKDHIGPNRTHHPPPTGRRSPLDDWKQPQSETTLAMTHNLDSDP